MAGTTASVLGVYGLHPCGGFLEGEASFGDYTIPARLRAGWGFGPPTYREPFRFEVTGASFSRSR